MWTFIVRIDISATANGHSFGRNPQKGKFSREKSERFSKLTSEYFCCTFFLEFCTALFAGNAFIADRAFAQQEQTTFQSTPTKPTPAQVALPDHDIIKRLIWTSLIALENANRTGNYSVFHQMSAPGFQKANSPQRLSQLFTKLREQNVDLAQTLTVTPNFSEPPKINKNGLLATKGIFELQPRQIKFEFYFQPVRDQWRLLSIGVNVTKAQPLGASSSTSDGVTKPTANKISNLLGKSRASLSEFDPWKLVAIAALILVFAQILFGFFARRRHKNTQDGNNATLNGFDDNFSDYHRDTELVAPVEYAQPVIPLNEPTLRAPPQGEPEQRGNPGTFRPIAQRFTPP
jgi:hypothetical protein